MKLLTAFGLLAVALAASSRWESNERSFQKGNTYEFEWNGQIVSGVPVKGSSSHSIQQIRSKVFITVNDKHSILRLENVKITNGHKQLTEPRIYSSEGSSLDESQLTQEQREQIKLPIRFKFHQGLVSEIMFSEEESSWSENIKRSVLNMIQVQMSPKKNEEMSSLEEKLQVNNKKFFTTTERTLEGDCEVAYTIVDGDRSREEKEITKSINFNKCSRRVDIRYGPRYSAECPQCEEADARPEAQTVISYKIRGEDEEYLIEQVELKSEYVFTPFSKDQEMLSTYVHQKMRLVKVVNAERVEEPRNGKKSSLLYNYETELAREKFWMNGDSASYEMTEFKNVPKRELMEKYLGLCVKSMTENEKDGVTLETNHNFARVVEIFRMCNEKEIREIHEKLWENESDKYQQILADALIAAGTKNTIEHFVEKVKKSQISPSRAAIIVKGLINIRIPSEKIVDSLLELAKSSVCQEEPALRQSVYLTIGALMNGVCFGPVTSMDEKRNADRQSSPSIARIEQWAMEIDEERECNMDLKNKWTKEWERLFKEADNKYEKVLIIKSLANSALDMSVHFLERIIYDRREPIAVRQAAVDALRMIRDQMPRKVQSVCLPLFKSRHEPVSIRISALYQLVHSRPTRALLDQIVHQLNIDGSIQLRSFGISLLKSLAESKKNPCEIKLAEDINVSLRMLRSSPLAPSTHVHLPWYSKVFDFGLTMDLASVFTNESVLPNELLASVDSIFAGQWNKHIFQIGAFQNNLDTVLLKLVKKLEKREEFTRGSRSKVQYKDLLKKLIRDMNIQTRDNDFKSEDGYGMLYMRYKNLDFAVLPIEEEMLTKMIEKESSLSSFDLIKKLTRGHRFEGVLSGFVYEHVRIVPTTFGLPLQVTSKLPTVVSVKSEIKMELSPKMMLRVEIEPSFVSTHVTEMTVFAPEMNLGSRVFHSIQSTIPLKGEIEFNYEKKSIKTSFELPREEKRVILLESRPTTFIRSFTSRQMPVLQEKTIRIPSFEKTSVHYEESYGERLFGLKTEVIGSVHRHVFEKKSPESVLFGENHVQVVLIPDGRQMEKIVLEIEPEYTSSSSFESLRYDEEFTENDFRLETSDESEERDNERMKRRIHSKKHYDSMRSLKGVEGKLRFKLSTVGGPKKIRSELELQGSCDEEMNVCRFNVEGERSPLLESERRDWTLKMNGQVVLPNSPKSIDELRNMGHKEIEAKIECEWGADEKNTITARLQKTQSSEMTRMLKNIEDEEMKGLEHYDTLREASKLNKYTLVIEKELSKDNEKTVRRLFDLIKAEFYMGGELENLHTETKKIRLEAVVEPEECRRVNLTLECNGERLIVKEAVAPIRIPLISLGSRPQVNQLRNDWTSVFMPKSQCEVSSTKVNTFDGLTYKTPLTTCYSVLAKDCSQEPEYVVMMKKREKNGEKKSLKIVTEEKEIVCEPKSEKIQCKVNGGKWMDDEERLEEHNIKLIGDDSCEIRIPKMTIRFDGYRAEIKADKRTENTQCGLCGHFDGRRDNEFRLADNRETENIEEFHRSWLNKEDECEMEEEKLREPKHYGIDSEEEDRYDSRERSWLRFDEDSDEEIYGEKRSRKMLKNTYKNQLNRKNIRNRDENTYEPEEEKVMIVENNGKTCFSMEKLRMCEAGDEQIETEGKKVRLACLPRSDRQTRRIVNSIKRGDERIHEEVARLDMSSVDRIEVAKLCRVY